MTAETEFRAALMASPAVASLLGQRVVINAAPADWPAPYIVFTAAHDYQRGMGGELLGDLCTIEAQCWADTAAQAAALADAVTAALSSVDAAPNSSTTGHDPELGMDAVILSVPWLTG